MKRALNGLPESLLKRLDALEPDAFAELDRRLRHSKMSPSVEEYVQAVLVSKWLDGVKDQIGDDARSGEFHALCQSRDRRCNGRSNDNSRLDGIPSASASPLARAMAREDLALLRAIVLTLPQRQRDALECEIALGGTGYAPTEDEKSDPSRCDKCANAVVRHRARKSAVARLKFE